MAAEMIKKILAWAILVVIGLSLPSDVIRAILWMIVSVLLAIPLVLWVLEVLSL